MPIYANDVQGGGAPLPSYMRPPTITTGTGTPVPLAPNPAPATPPAPNIPWQNAITYEGAGITPEPIHGPGGLVGGITGPGGSTPPAAPYPTSSPQNQAPSGGGGSNPFLSDPGYQAALSQEQLGVGTLNQQLNNQIAQRIIAFGDPALASMAGFGLDPQSAAFARQNYLSGNAELARLDAAHKQARQAIINRLAAHGLLTSGDTGYQEGLEDQGYGNNVYDAQQKALADILGYRQSALDRQDALHAATVSALENAYNTYVQNPALYGLGTPTGGGAAPTPPPAKTPVTPAPKTTTRGTALKTRLVNPYTTGQKVRG